MNALVAALRGLTARSPSPNSEGTTKSLTERLMRVWAERGDFSKVTEQSIRNPALHAEQEDSKADEDEDKDTRPTVEDVRKLQETMIYSLA